MTINRTVSALIAKTVTVAALLGGTALLASAPASADEPAAGSAVVNASVSAPLAASSYDTGSYDTGSHDTVVARGGVASIDYFEPDVEAPRWLAELDYDALQRSTFEITADGTFTMIQPDGYAALVGTIDASGAIFACTCGSDVAYADMVGQLTTWNDGTTTLDFDYWGTAFASDGSAVNDYFLASVTIAAI